MKKFFNNNIEKKCEYCKKGQLSKNGENVLCKRKGVVSKEYSCIFFEYDPIMRRPKITAPTLPEYDAEDFKI